MRTRVPGWLGGGAAALTLLLAMLTWAFASPVGSAPDEDNHTANIYCLHDSSTCRSRDWTWPWSPPWWHPDPADRTGPEYAGAKRAFPDLWAYPEPRQLPCFVLNGTNWYAPDPAVPATCLNDEDPRNNQPASLDRLEYYPNHYYRFLSLFTGDSIRESVATWRILNAALATVMLSAAMLLTARRYRRAVAVGSLVAAMPLGLFLISSINPTSWLIIGSAAFLGPAVSMLRDRGSPRLLATRIGFVSVCLLMVLAGRSEGPGIAAMLVIVALVLGLQAPRVVYGVLGVGIAITATAVVLRSDSILRRIDAQWVRDGITGERQWDTLMAVPGHFFGPDAYRLGWLEPMLPPAAVVATSAAFWGAAALGLAVVSWRKILALVVVAGTLLGVPAILIAGGWTYQPTRYFLPLVFMLAFVVLLPGRNDRMTSWARPQWVALWASLSLANSLALLYLTVRYVSGIAPGTAHPRVLAATPAPEWWWGAWLSPFGNWLLGTLAFAAALGLVFSLPGVRGGAADHADSQQAAPLEVTRPQPPG